MTRSGLEPAPREYAPFVTVRRRSQRGRSAYPQKNTPEEVERWLLTDAMAIDDFMDLSEEFFWRALATGAPLHRTMISVGTLHPQLSGYSWHWRMSDEIIDEVMIASSSRDEAAFKNNPLSIVLDAGETVRGDPRDPAMRARFSLFVDLHAQGMTDYIARPIGSRTSRAAGTISTFAPDGFSDEDVAIIDRLFDIFSLHAERHMQRLMLRNVTDAYLGGTAGGDVIEGAIERGAGRSLRSVVWASDMRGFSEKADRLAPEETTALLNLYFEALSGAVMAHGGEVLKFIGDGMLAVFPIAADGEAAAGRRAIAAARAGLDRVDALNDDPPAALAPAALPVRSGVGLHLGEVFFGNVGAPDRLDFTVIGRAVNEAVRVEALTKSLGREILVTGPVAGFLERAGPMEPAEPLEPLGEHALKGVAAPMQIYAASRAGPTKESP